MEKLKSKNENRVKLIEEKKRLIEEKKHLIEEAKKINVQYQKLKKEKEIWANQMASGCATKGFRVQPA